MEVESQWRREWAGAAEYGKVTEGGVTRKVARALEVLHASRPGTQVRVMRAAWHSSAGPGAPASSYMVHSSQQFISSGSRLLTSPSLIKMSQPMEISSTPLDYSPDDGTDTENYKVTEPDDFEISQPSKWKSSNNRSSLRMPSEESSSTDNGSIIDLDFKNNSSKNNTWRRHSYESENSDVPKYKSRASPLLENPTTLSTLKYKSLLNNTNSSWDNRRKSYSFEDSATVNDGNVERNDILAMESSTDSGICKSSELVNEKIDEEPEFNCINTEQFTNQLHEDSFKNWLARNRPNKIHKINVKVEKAKPVDNQFSLQSTGKVSISLASDPVTLTRRKKDEDDLRKAKRVEFCKTELHFAAESGRVNIISTDEKPPPSNDFRKRRSAFVPMKDNFDIPVTLFGDKFDDLLVINGNTNLNEVSECEQSDDYEENTAATKSILKNKIPKPKPYLLGENMEFGDKYYLQDNLSKSVSKPTAVSLINKQLDEPECIKKKSYECREAIHKNNWENKKLKDEDRTVVERSLDTKKTIDDQREVIHSIKVLQSSPILQKSRNRQLKESELDNDNQSEFKRSIKLLQSSPILQAKSRTRQLKESELTYFGIKNKDNEKNYKKANKISPDQKDNMFNAVRLVQEATYNTSQVNKSDDEFSNYQNLPLRTDYIPVPVPRSRLKADTRIEDITKGHNEVVQEIEQIMNSRRRRLKKQEDDNNKLRSISEPPKNRKTSSSVANIITRDNKCKANPKLEENIHSPVISLGESDKTNKLKRVQDKPSKNNKGAPIYQNIEIEKKRAPKNKTTVENNGTLQMHSRPRSQNKKSDRNASTPENKIKIVHDHNDDQQLKKSNKESHKSKDMKHKSKDMMHQSKSTHEYNINGKSNSTEKDSRNKYNKENVSKESDIKTSTNNTNKSAYESHNISKKGDNCSSDIKKGSHSYNRKANNEVNHDKRHKRKEYVLNYDDKNGTFSSMNKVKHRSKSSDRGINDYSTKKKTPDNKNEGKSKEKYPLRK